MDLKAEKLELVQMVLDIEDKAIIKKIKALIKTEEDDFWNELPDEVKESVNRGLADVKAGRTKPHAEAMAKYEKWLKK